MRSVATFVTGAPASPTRTGSAVSAAGAPKNRTPQHHARWSADTAHDARPNALVDTCTMFDVNPLTFTGVALDFAAPLPSSPLLPLPQQNTSPVLVTAHALTSFTARSTTPESAGTFEGTPRQGVNVGPPSSAG